MPEEQMTPEQIRELLKTTEGLAPETIFAGLPMAFKADEAKGENIVFQWELSGENRGTWFVKIQDGKVEVNPATHPSPTITIQTDADTFVKMAKGEANETSLFMQGKIKVKGNPMAAMKFRKYFL
jgi:putative sterol carrier protein